MSSAIPGIDPATGSAPDNGAAQVGLAFGNLERFLESADSNPAEVARVTVLLADNDLRPKVNDHWVAMFPDETSRPARHISIHGLPNNLLIQLEVVAFSAST